MKLNTNFFKKKSNKIVLDKYWIQDLNVKYEDDRLLVFKPYLLDKRVLHIGCVDYPIFKPENNLHLAISKITKSLDGMDVNKEGLNLLKTYYDSNYFDDLEMCLNMEYDTVLIPETIEHVENIGSFLKQISMIQAENFIITGPNAFNDYLRNPYNEVENVFSEAVHPDHNCWFSPYTLKNVIEKYSNLKVNSVYISNNKLMIICICSKNIN